MYDLQVLKIDGFTALYNEGALNKNYAVIVYIKNDIHFTLEVKKLGDLSLLELSAEIESQKVTLSAIYGSPSKCPRKFNLDLHQYVPAVKENDMHIITGDINIDLLSTSDFSEEYKNILSTSGYESYIDEWTRPKSQTCLDHFHVGAKTQRNIKSFIFHLSITDHYPIALTVDLNRKSAGTSRIDHGFRQYIDYPALKTA